jgi:hypothetical protein
LSLFCSVARVADQNNIKTRLWLINQETGSVKPRVVFTFNDLLLIAREQSHLYYLRFRIALPNVEVYDSPSLLIDGKQVR